MANRFTGNRTSDVLILGPVVRRIPREHKVGEPAARAWLEARTAVTGPRCDGTGCGGTVSGDGGGGCGGGS